jgi:hypothetical protein
MEKYAVPILILFVGAAAAVTYGARPRETPEQYAHRTCKETPAVGVTYERCIEGRMLQQLAGRKGEER